MKHILIVDDNHDMNFLIGELLQQNGYRVLSVFDGKSALNRLQKESIDLILLDIRLQKMTGFEVIQEMKMRKISIPIILITSFGDENTKLKAIRAGARDLITKPFINTELLSKIRAVFH